MYVTIEKIFLFICRDVYHNVCDSIVYIFRPIILTASHVDIYKSSSFNYYVTYMHFRLFILLMNFYFLSSFLKKINSKQFTCQHYCSCFFVRTSKGFSSRCLEIKLLPTGHASLCCQIALRVIVPVFTHNMLYVFVCMCIIFISSKIEILLSVYFCGSFSHLTFYWELVSWSVLYSFI